MVTFNYNSKKHSYNPVTKTFVASEKDIPFDTEYKIINPKTGSGAVFTFSHSTGPEFDDNTQWVYYNSDKTFSLVVCNDKKITQINAANYLAAKTSI